MNKSEFRAKHSELIGYYQYIEMRLKGICAVILADESIMDEALHIGVDSFLAKPLFASNVIDEFERIALKNDMSLYKEKNRAELKGKRILMAEDVMINAEITAEIIMAKEAKVDHAENGRIALEMFDKSPVSTETSLRVPKRRSSITKEQSLPFGQRSNTSLVWSRSCSNTERHDTEVWRSKPKN